MPAWPALFSSNDLRLHHHRRYTPSAARALIANTGLQTIRSASLFHSLLLPRAFQVARESLSRRRCPPATLHWNGSPRLTKLIVAALSCDAWLSRVESRLGWSLPGLSGGPLPTAAAPPTPLVSVVVPTHNRAALLKRTLRSIVDQQLTDLEVLVIDDGSTDDTQVTAGRLDRRVRILRNPAPTGVSAARNRGIAAARGEWIAFVTMTTLAPDKLTRQLAAVQDAHREWAYVGDVNVDGNLRVLCGGPPPDPDAVVRLLPRWNPLASGGSNVIVRAEALEAAGGFDPTLRRTEDWDLWIRLARMGPPACVAWPLWRTASTGEMSSTTLAISSTKRAVSPRSTTSPWT